MDRKLAAILSADVAGFSRLAALDEEGTLAALNVCRNRIAEVVKEHGGRIFGTAGDGFVAEFPSAVQAVRCSVEIQRRLFSTLEDRPPDRPLEFRIGINLGDVVVAGDDLLGDGVNTLRACKRSPLRQASAFPHRCASISMGKCRSR